MTITFSALDYTNSESLQYAYRLKGINDQWGYIGENHSIGFANLPAGDFVLEVKSTNGDGVWHDNITPLHIHIQPRFTETIWAWIVYVFIVIILILTVSGIIIYITNLKRKVDFEEHFLDSSKVFDYIITVWNKKEYVKVRISDSHMHVVCIEKNGQILQEEKSVVKKEKADRSLLDIKDIYDFIKTVELTDIQDILERQIDYNYAIACAGLNDNYGANIGKVLLKSFGNDVKNKAKAYAAAGSDARMNGCELPVVINSGSGNQGMTCSLPVIIYAQELKVSKEKMFRALALSNLVAIHEKSGIGTLSAYCGAVSAATGAGAGIAYLYDEDYQAVIHTIVNTLANVSGIVCDGAKASCAAKIASSVDAAILGYHMYKNGQEFKSGDGLVMENVEATIQSVGRLGREGMRETNKEIIKMMIHE